MHDSESVRILTLRISKGKVEDRALLDYYAASSDNLLQTFRDNLSVPSLRVKNLKGESGTLVRGLYRKSVEGDIMQRKGCAFACHKGICRSKCVGYTGFSPRQQMHVMVSFTPPLLLLEYTQNRKLGWPQG
jgi:hypothetical protein